MVDFKSCFMSLKASRVYRLVNGEIANSKFIHVKDRKVSNTMIYFNDILDDSILL